MNHQTDQSGYQHDLDTCDLEPIHTPGRVQPFGVLLAGPADLSKITYCSENVAGLLDMAPADVLGHPLAALLGEQLVHDLRNLVTSSTARHQRERAGIYDLSMGRFEAYVHLNPQNQAVIELEPASDASGSDGQSAVNEMRKYLSAASARDTIQAMLDASVVGLGALTGYDRVLAYRYEANGDGEVVSECRNANTPSFLGLRYPAWDVPEQARALQVKNPLRMLSDVKQDPVPVLAHDASAAPLDMSLAHIRGVSPVHVEYMGNMGVAASLTVGLVVDGKLWGMFACHHQSPRMLTSDVRIAVELFGQMISLVIKQKQDLEDTRLRHRAATARERMLAETDAKTDLLHSFPDLAPILAEVIECDGLAITYEGKTLTHGSTPSAAAIKAMGAHKPEEEDLIHPVINIGKSGLITSEALDHTAGMLMIRATAAYPLQLFYFRDEKIRSLNWAGRPEKTLEPGPMGPRISPRGSFDAYVENQRGYATDWTKADLAAARELQILLTQITAKGERVQLMRHKDLVTHQRQQDLMIAELNHRVKNILALIRSLSRQAKASSASLESYALALEQRISALAAAHDLAVSNTMKGVSLRGILKTELEPYLADEGAQVLMSGPIVGLRADVAPIVALVLHEIVSNAAKYGALSTEEGIVRVKWTVEDGHLGFTWQEINGPDVSKPERHGFGRALIEKAIPFELDGQAELTFDPAGVRMRFELPPETLVDLDGETEVKLVGSIPPVQKVASGKLALLVEDNVVLAMDMVDSLTRLGTETVETAPSVDAAMRLLDRHEFDFALLDMNLRGSISFDVAERLLKLGTTFMFVTGYGSSIDVPPELRQVPILTKPVDEGTLSKTIQDVLQ